MSQGHRAAPAGRGRASQRTYMVRRLVALAFVVALGWGLVSVIATVFGDGDPQQAAAVQPTIITVVNDGQPTTVPVITAPPTVVTEPPVKERTVPSAENPAELLILGDSDAGSFGPYLQTLLDATGMVTTALDYKTMPMARIP